MAATIVELAVCPLAIQLDMACPIAWPSMTGTRPLAPAGPAQVSLTDTDSPPGTAAAFVRERYLQTLYLPDILAPLDIFALDLLRLHRPGFAQRDTPAQEASASESQLAEPTQRSDGLADALLTLPAIEKKHRKVIPSLINALLRTTLVPQAGGSSGTNGSSQTTAHEGVQDDGAKALQLGLEFRLAGAKGSLANALNGTADDLRRAVKKVTDELERREVMLQILLLLAYTTHHPKRAGKTQTKKGKAVEGKASDDPRKTLDMLTDRMNVWQAVAGLADDVDAAKTDEEGWIPRFCRDVVQRHFGASHTKFCASFHTKIFGVPAAAQSVDRAPSPSPSARSLSRAPSLQPQASTSHSRRNSIESRTARPDFQRAGSVASLRDDARSRSRSRDPSASAAHAFAPRPLVQESAGLASINVLQSRRPGVRVASGKNLFKGREVGLSRTSSFSTTMAAGALARQADAKGLMAVVGKRKTLYVPQGTRRLSGETLPVPAASMGPPKAVVRQTSAPQVRPAATPLAMATPSKPRAFARAHTLAQVTRVIPPNPIQEAGPAFVAETPSSSAGKRRRQSDDAASIKRPSLGTLWPAQKHKRAPSSGDEELGRLMVDTDDEGDEPAMDVQSLPAYMVMETPRKA